MFVCTCVYVGKAFEKLKVGLDYFITRYLPLSNMPKTPFHISKYISTTVFLVAEDVPLHHCFLKIPYCWAVRLGHYSILGEK